MILTVTMNPSIDTRYTIDHLVVDDVNRVVPRTTPGGKGLNVSRVLCQLGDDVVATGLLGGHMGAFLADRMDDDGIPHDFVAIEGESRICIAVIHDLSLIHIYRPSSTSSSWPKTRPTCLRSSKVGCLYAR